MIKGDMKPEMKRILTTLFDTEDEYLEITQIAELLEVKYQEARYYVDKLQKQWLIYLNESETNCCLTSRGRAYVMEKLRK